MKHTNVLLKQKGDGFYEEAELASKQKAQSLDDLQKRLRLVTELARSEGWAYFVSELKNEKSIILGLMEKASDPTTLAKLTGSLLVVESFSEWPGFKAQELDAQAKDINRA